MLVALATEGFLSTRPSAIRSLFILHSSEEGLIGQASCLWQFIQAFCRGFGGKSGSNTVDSFVNWKHSQQRNRTPRHPKGGLPRGIGQRFAKRATSNLTVAYFQGRHFGPNPGGFLSPQEKFGVLLLQMWQVLATERHFHDQSDTNSWNQLLWHHSETSFGFSTTSNKLQDSSSILVATLWTMPRHQSLCLYHSVFFVLSLWCPISALS